MIPFFLHFGRHVQRDLPDIMEELKRRYPGVQITLGPHIGFHPKLAEIILDRIRETETNG